MQDVVVDEHEQARAVAASFTGFFPHRWFSVVVISRYCANLDDASQEAIWGISPHAKEAERPLFEVFRSRGALPPSPGVGGLARTLVIPRLSSTATSGDDEVQNAPGYVDHLAQRPLR